jgi:ribulose-5-phosphate 4-epimerase/fuculose-1-phosphate aldolase
MRLPGPDHHFLINPYGVFFEEMTASALVKIDLEGNVQQTRAANAVMLPPADRVAVSATPAAILCQTKNASRRGGREAVKGVLVS